MVKQTQLQYYMLTALYSGGTNATSAMLMIFLLSRGLDESAAMLAYAFYFLALTILEVPTGARADVGGKRRAFVLSCIINAFGMVAYAIADSFLTVAIAASITGVGVALAGGTLDSWMVNNLKRSASAQSVDLTFIKGSIVKCIVSATSGFAGIMLAGESMQWAWIIACALFVAAGVLAHITMDEDASTQGPTAKTVGMWTTARDGFRFFRKNENVRFTVIAVGALYCTAVIPNMLWQPHFQQWLPDRSYLGYIWVLAQVANLLGVLLVMVPKVLGREMNDRASILTCLAVAGTGMLGTAIMGDFAASTMMYMVYQAGRGAFGPINMAYLHRNIGDDRVRTTVASIEAIGHHIGSALGLVVGAQVVLLISREGALIGAGVTLLMIVAILWRRRIK